MSEEAGPTGDQYYGVLAEAYDAYLSSTDFNDLSVYENIIKSVDRTALELACGTGRILLPLLEAGYSVEGMDSSDEMLALCLSKGEAMQQKQTPVLHHSKMENFELGTKFGTIFCAVASFTLIPTLEAMEQSLICIKSHLKKNGIIAINMDCPSMEQPKPSGKKMVREAVLADRDITYRCWMETVSPIAVGTERHIMTNELIKSGEVARSDESFLTFFRPSPRDFVDLIGKVGFRDVQLLDCQAQRPFEFDKDREYLVVAKNQ